MTTERESVVIAAGSYTSADRGRGRGVTLFSLDPAGPALSPLAHTDLEDPSFLLWSADGDLLHVVHETEPTRLTTLRVADDAGGLETVGSLELQGAGGCHLAHGVLDGTLIVTDYGSGTVEVVRLDADGAPIAILDACEHGRYRPGREAHPHQAVVLPGTDIVAVTDLGLDRIYLYRQDGHGGIDLAGEITAGAGTGPRHLAADHESATLYLTCELSGELADAVRTLPATDDRIPRWQVRPGVPATGSGQECAPSHVEVSAHENHVLLAARGPDTLAAFTLGMMRPELVSEIRVGAHPRHFARVGELVLVAAQEADRIDLIRWDGTALSRAADPVPAPSVTCLAPRPR